MPQDTYTTEEKKNFLSRIFSSFVGVIVGILLFFGSFIILFINEGTENISKFAQKSEEINSQKSESNHNGKFVSVSGKISSDEKIGDELFIKADSYIAVKRTVEMYSWEENKKSNTKEEIGGSETTKNTYSYNKVWTEFPSDSEKFKLEGGHENPKKEIESNINKVNQAKIGNYLVDLKDVGLPVFSMLNLNKDNFLLSIEDKGIYQEQGFDLSKYKDVTLANNMYIYKGKGNIDNPEIGDLRISYETINNNIDVTIFGKLENNNIVKYEDQSGVSLFRIFASDRDGSIEILLKEYKMKLWIFRGIGFFVMWFGLNLLFGPINTILSILPIFSKVSRSVFAGISFLVALVLSLVTIVVGMIFYNIYVLIGALILSLVGVYIFVKKKKSKQ